MKNASFATAASPTPDLLLGGEFGRVSVPITLLSGQNTVRGAVLGKVTLAGSSSAVKAGGNTGGGTLTLDVTTPILAGAKPGIYKVRCFAVVANAGMFSVVDPDGIALGVYAIGQPVAFSNQVKFAMADVGTDFALGDGFDITIAAGSGKYVLAVAAAVDGSSTPQGLLVEDTDATAADRVASLYVTGEFNKAALVFGAGHDATSVAEDLRKKNIYLKDVLAA